MNVLPVLIRNIKLQQH